MGSATPSHYEVLGIGPRATAEEVEKAYRYTLELYGDGALATYSLLDPEEVRRARARVQEAYEVLRDPVRRQAYNLSHGLGAPPPARSLPTGPRTVEFAPSRAPAEVAAPEAAPPAPSPRTPQVLGEPVTGSVLRRHREERGITLREIANQTKIGTRFLEYIEGDRHDMLPAHVYLRGFLQEYARAVGLDPRRTAASYMAQFPRPWPED